MVAKISEIDSLIRSKGLNATDIRRKVVKLLYAPGTALTQKEIEEELEKAFGTVDRVTLYRTIKALTEKDIIHQISIDSHTIKHKLVREHVANEHPHFHCSMCNKLICMPQLNIDENMLPGGFRIESSSVLIEGVCSICNRTQH